MHLTLQVMVWVVRQSTYSGSSAVGGGCIYSGERGSGGCRVYWLLYIERGVLEINETQKWKGVNLMMKHKNENGNWCSFSPLTTQEDNMRHEVFHRMVLKSMTYRYYAGKTRRKLCAQSYKANESLCVNVWPILITAIVFFIKMSLV